MVVGAISLRNIIGLYLGRASKRVDRTLCFFIEGDDKAQSRSLVFPTVSRTVAAGRKWCISLTKESRILGSDFSFCVLSWSRSVNSVLQFVLWSLIFGGMMIFGELDRRVG